MSFTRKVCCTLALLAFSSCKSTNSVNSSDKSMPANASSGSSTASSAVGVYHIVTLRFKNDAATLAQIPAQIKAFENLKTTAVDPNGQPYLLSWTYGLNNSQLDLSFSPQQGVDHSREYVFVTTLATPQSRDLYIATPAHTAFLSGVLPYLDGGLNGGIIVVDFAPAPNP